MVDARFKVRDTLSGSHQWWPSWAEFPDFSLLLRRLFTGLSLRWLVTSLGALIRDGFLSPHSNRTGLLGEAGGHRLWRTPLHTGEVSEVNLKSSVDKDRTNLVSPSKETSGGSGNY